PPVARPFRAARGRDALRRYAWTVSSPRPSAMRLRRVSCRTFAAILSCALLAAALRSSGTAGDEAGWPMHGGVDNIRYSPLAQVSRDNVTKLHVAWTYDSHDAFKGSEMQSNPVVVDGVLYATTPALKVIALDAATGHERWRFDTA